MRAYQITRKMQVTVPKKMAERAGIKPGDLIAFNEAGGVITIKKLAEARESSQQIKSAIEEFAKDVVKIRGRVKKAQAALIEDFSRHITDE